MYLRSNFNSFRKTYNCNVYLFENSILGRYVLLAALIIRKLAFFIAASVQNRALSASISSIWRRTVMQRSSETMGAIAAALQGPGRDQQSGEIADGNNPVALPAPG